jgi:hypothetical protein
MYVLRIMYVLCLFMSMYVCIYVCIYVCMCMYPCTLTHSTHCLITLTQLTPPIRTFLANPVKASINKPDKRFGIKLDYWQPEYQ